MKFNKILKLNTILLSSLSTIAPIFSTSCNSRNEQKSLIKNIDGTDWEGLNRGCFAPSDYILDEENKTITYISSFGIHAYNLIVPDYVLLNNVKYKVYLGEYCFYKNIGLAGSLELNIFIDTIPKWCFYECSSLTSVYFHQQPKKIDDFSFTSCKLLQVIKVIKGPSILDNWTMDISYIGKYSFYECTLLSNDLNFSSILENLSPYAFYQCKLIGDINLKYSNKITNIPEGCFSGCGCTKVTLPEKIDNIENYAFKDCSELFILESSEIQQDVTLGIASFFNCSELTFFPTNITIIKMGEKCFANNINLKITPWQSADAEISLEEIPYNAFTGCNYTSLYLTPNGVKTIQDYAFSYNSNLNFIDFSEYKISDGIPNWDGYNIFKGSSKSGGTILLKSEITTDTELFQDWKDFLISNGINLFPGEDQWVIRNTN